MTKKIGIIGAGIVGATTAFYLSDEKVELTLFDDGLGQATAASAGIISPWLSQRRNKEWYYLAKEGAKFYDTLIKELNKYVDTTHLYQKTGTLLFKKDPTLLKKLEHLAMERKKEAPEIGEISLISHHNGKKMIPRLSTQNHALYISGGGKIDGGKLVNVLLDQVKKRNHTFFNGKVDYLKRSNQKWHVSYRGNVYAFDKLILACGAWLGDLLAPLNFDVDIHPQKGQLIEIQTDFNSTNWPVIIPVGEMDIIPFDQGKIIVGATHENDKGFNLDPTPHLLTRLKDDALPYINDLVNYPISQVKVGTRAYTSDFSPFFGEVDSLPHLFVASGLGSSGLTTGPVIGKTLADWVLKKETLFESYRFKPNNYIFKKE